jgi:G2/mitotic-specific cyclin 2
MTRLQTRPTRQRAVTNENDENVAVTRVTRAKAAALSNTDGAAGDVPKKAPLAKKSVSNGLGAAQPRKRAALGDVSNVGKGDAAEGKDGKKAAGKAGLVSKASQPSKIQKPGRSTTRSTASTKDRSTTSELKRPASTSGIGGHASKKRITSNTIREDDEAAAENAAPSKQSTTVEVNIQKAVKVDSHGTTQAESLEIKAEAEADDSAEVQDLDLEDLDDPLMVAEYVGEIFEYLKQLEISTLASPTYMDDQPELEWKMRGILVDWLLEVHTRFHLLPETLFLAVNIIDRFLTCKVVQLDRLQLVGVTAMFIASKYEEVISPHVSNYRHVADDGFTEDEILSAERFILAALNYDLSYPNPMNFLRRVSKADNYDIETRTLGKYLLEISCLDHRFIPHPPSLVSAAAMYLARLVLSRGPWDATLAHYAGYTEEEIQPVFKLMVDYLRSPVVHEAFFKKYASKKFLKGMFSPTPGPITRFVLTQSTASIVLRQWAKKSYQQYLGPSAKKASAGDA